MKWGKDRDLVFTVDVFNVFNFQAVTARDERYTQTPVQPIVNGTVQSLNTPSPIKLLGGGTLTPGEVNMNFGQPTQYQDPRQFRFGLRTPFSSRGVEDVFNTRAYGQPATMPRLSRRPPRTSYTRTRASSIVSSTVAGAPKMRDWPRPTILSTT